MIFHCYSFPRLQFLGRSDLDRQSVAKCVCAIRKLSKTWWVHGSRKSVKMRIVVRRKEVLYRHTGTKYGILSAKYGSVWWRETRGGGTGDVTSALAGVTREVHDMKHSWRMPCWRGTCRQLYYRSLSHGRWNPALRQIPHDAWNSLAARTISTAPPDNHT